MDGGRDGTHRRRPLRRPQPDRTARAHQVVAAGHRARRRAAGREFAFATEEGGVEGTTWRYRFEPVAGGTRVTESYTVEKIPVWARIMDVPLNRHGDLLKNMATTLDRLKTAAEHSTPAVEPA